MKDWANQIDRLTGMFLNSFSPLSEDDLNWKPGPETWSIAENMEHLIILNESYFPGFERLNRGNYDLPFIARFGFVVKFFGNLILKSVNPDRNKKMKTFPLWQPSKSNFSKEILNRFETHQNKLKEEILSTEHHIKENAVISSPANKNIVYKLETAFEILISHEKRHYNQANEIYQLLKEQKS
ncbi:DinB family protein [Christiangramia sp. SM2212]|uniref:DinB family protein n=1 Tax=Christiangramia sediminicola TaxID=3073267 RepID=A0ABU1EMK1_9FLAO|nr:DinB family protein [Christiangramia sp. SM2212]MDR5589609.1 DinB family protein [Christiangramia sp. SM2212]